jgi:hypothetical protein
VFWAEAAPLSHPTNRFQLKIGFDSNSYEVVGYAFRRTRNQGDGYEGIPVGYGESDALTVVVPKSERGDEVFIVARIALRGAKEFPNDLKGRLRLNPGELKEGQ